jgi:two-component system sensor histidine kinase KdpD
LEHQRPDPDELLGQITAAEAQEGRGKLRIFLGYAAGVGKTYTMLLAGRQRKGEGVDVVVGYVETHKRAETEALVEGMEIVPRRKVEYRGAELEEMDVDAVLARRPGLALVDELAHTNAPGSRHPKRHQDVEELLAAGIDVYTTLNIQHIESLNDAVAQITGVKVRETVPDGVLDEAAEIEIIDLPPDELLQRLAEGKVYVPEQAAQAVERFFRKGNLSALREMVLRRAASRVDEQMRSYMRTKAIPGPWPAGERLLVCVGPGPLSARLLRTTRRLAEELRADWHALYVETPPSARTSAMGKDAVAQNLRLAEELGAQVAMRTGTSIADTVVAYARQHNVTKIIVGKPLMPRWAELIRGSVVDQIIRQSGIIDVYVISSAAGAPAVRKGSGRPRMGRAEVRPYALGVGLVAAATALGFPVRHMIEPTNLVMLYLAAVVLAGLYLGRGPSIMTSLLSVAAFDFFFIPPRFTMAVSDTQYLLTFLGLFVVGLVISALADRVRYQMHAAQTREAETYEVYSLSRDLASGTDEESVTRAVLTRMTQTFGYAAVIMIAGDGRIAGQASLRSMGATPGLEIDEDERAVATWAYQHGQAAGEGTDTLPGAALRYMPLTTGRRTLGVIGVRRQNRDAGETPDRRRLLDAFVNQAALAYERVELGEQARRVDVLDATEKLQTALLSSVSHELRTPLASITGVLSSLKEATASQGTFRMKEEALAGLAESALGEAERLNHLVGNLLDMTRLEAGALRVNAEPVELEDLMGAVLAQFSERARGHEIEVAPMAGLPMVPLDFVLIAQVLVNLLDNAVKYSPPGAPVEVAAKVLGDEVEISVADIGPGIPESDLERIFDKFYRVSRPETVSGTGLGLAICRGIVEAHGGHISAANRPGGGTIVTVTLPREAVIDEGRPVE